MAMPLSPTNMATLSTSTTKMSMKGSLCRCTTLQPLDRTAGTLWKGRQWWRWAVAEEEVWSISIATWGLSRLQEWTSLLIRWLFVNRPIKASLLFLSPRAMVNNSIRSLSYRTYIPIQSSMLKVVTVMVTSKPLSNRFQISQSREDTSVSLISGLQKIFHSLKKI